MKAPISVFAPTQVGAKADMPTCLASGILGVKIFDSSEEFMGKLRLGQLAK